MFSRFLQDLYRRRVPHFLAAYLLAAWAVVEFIDLITQRRGLSPQWVDLAIVVLLALVPTVLLVSYFHGGPGRQKPTTLEKIGVPANLMAATVLAYSLFAGEDLGAVLKPDTHVLRHEQITFTGRARSSAIAPDGESVAYVSVADDSTFLLVQGITDGETTELLRTANETIRQLSWSPDGSMIAFMPLGESREVGVYAVPVHGGPVRKLASSGAVFAWSPDGSKIVRAYGNISNANYFIVTDTALTEETRIPVVAADEWLQSLAWSPSGDVIAFLTRHKEIEQHTISTITIDGERQHKLVEDSVVLSSPRWSRDGGSLYYRRGWELWKIGVSPTTGAPAGPGPGERIDAGIRGDFSISSDGKRLTYARFATESNLWALNLDRPGSAGEPESTQLTSTTSRKNYPTISPDGQTVAFVNSGYGGFLVHTVPVSGGSIVQVTDRYGFGPPAWSPDGSSIAYVSQIGDPKVWVTSSSGGSSREYAQSEPAVESWVTWCSETGILYQRPSNRDFHFIDPETGEEWPLLGEGSSGFVFYARCSPDGRKVAVYWNRAGPGLWVISLDDSSQRLLLGGMVVPIGWSADGEWILAREGRSRDIIRVPAEGGEPETLVKLPFDPGTEFGVVAAAPDLSVLVVLVVETESDIWMIENFDPNVQ